MTSPDAPRADPTTTATATMTGATGTAAAWLSTYRQGEPRLAYDEVLDGAGTVRPPWQRLFDTLTVLDEAELRRRWEQARAMLHEHGVSYDAYGGSQGVARPWNLSPIPVVLDAAAWGTIAKGVAQRARLLDRILADLYGPRRLLSSGALPPEIVLGHPGFLRPCVGIAPPGGRFLPLYAADLARAPDGNLMVLADRTRTPSGAGYTLENRIVLSRALPEVFRECNVQRLAPFFRAMRDMLKQLAPHDRDNPRIVLLTPGPYNATYFEQAFLAQYLGLTLVEGGDLAVRDHRVYLKTLGGLQAVDVILRRVQDDMCDPLELRPDSQLGVPGLVEAARAGNVAIVNPLGSTLVQTAALTPYLPGLCRTLLGEDLLLGSVPTYWCGDPKALAYVESHLTELVVRPTYPTPSGETVFARDLASGALEDLRARIRAQPQKFVAQEAVVLSTVPVLTGEGLTPAHLWMRAYATASRDSYEVMPGGLSRVGGTGESLGLSLRPGGQSKDTWILAGAPVAAFSLLPPPSAPISLSRGGGDLPSRVGDNLFWLGRYAERAEGTARLARVIGGRLTDPNVASDADLASDVDTLFAMLEAKTQMTHPKDEPSDGAARTNWLRRAEHGLTAAVFDDEPLETLYTTVAATYRVARTVRDRISSDTWRTLTQLDADISHARRTIGSTSLRALMALLDRVLAALAAFSGLAVDSMTRGQAWRFLDMGRRLERAIHMTTLLRVGFEGPVGRDGPLLEALLDVADSSMTYRRRYLSTLQAAPVVDLLLTDESNPRSVLFQLGVLSEHVDALPHEPVVPRTDQQRLLLSASTELKLADVLALTEPDEHAERPALLALLDRLDALLPELSNSISGVYLNHAVVSRQLQGSG